MDDKSSEIVVGAVTTVAGGAGLGILGWLGRQVYKLVKLFHRTKTLESDVRELKGAVSLVILSTHGQNQVLMTSKSGSALARAELKKHDDKLIEYLAQLGSVKETT